MNQAQRINLPTNISQIHVSKTRLIWPLRNFNLRRSICCVLILCLWALSSPVVLAENPTITEAQREFFEKKIRPVLAEQCYDCHNSNNKKKGGLALDWSQPLRKGGDSGEVIIPGDPNESLLIQSIRHQADVEDMPDKAPKLVDSVIADFTKWVSMGAPDPRHTQPTSTSLEKEVRSWDDVRNDRKKWWSFQPITSPEPPKVNKADWSYNPIDAFVYDRLKQQELLPSDLADSHTLLRRVSLVLTGLPPSPDDVATFTSNKDPKRYEKYVDTLLGSKAYAERWARHWMDWYRYSESHGSEGDPRIAFAQQYRDYLIRALEQDVPYDQLMIEHLAGDLLAKPRLNHETHINESAIGPAHLRMNPFGYGVVDAYQELVAFTDNQVDVVSKATMALTVSCARCHDHKFDPVSQKDYTRFYGVMISNRPATIVVDSQEKQRRHQDAIKQLKPQIKKAFTTYWLSQMESLEDRLEKVKSTKKQHDSDALTPWLRMKEKGPKEFESYWKELQGHVKRVKAHNKKVKEGAVAYYDLRDPKVVATFFKTGNGSHLSPQPAGSFALRGEGENVFQGVYPAGVYSHLISTKHAAVMGSPRMTAAANNLWVRAAGSKANRRYAVRHYPFGGLLHDNHRLDQPVPVWQGSRKMDIWQGEKIHYEFRTARDVINQEGDERSWWGVSEILMGPEAPQSMGAPLSLWVATPPVDQASLLEGYETTIQSILNKWMAGTVSDEESEFLGQLLQRNVLNHDMKQLPENVVALVEQYRRLENEIPVPTRAPGVYEADPVDAPFLNRGDHQSEGEAVPRQFLEIFANKPYNKNSGRLELAQDITSDNNPLTRRVLVNRLWNYVFGAGLVTTTDNFGRMGGQPSHPELLDFLANDFKRNGWSLKKSLKLMVTSHSFKLSSQSNAAAKELDPDNKYLSFFKPRRLDAEAIYDSLHFVAGQNKRAIYDSVIRNRLHPFLTAFNRPVPVTTVSRRPSDNVPAQALSMMNGLAEDLTGHLLNRVDTEREVDVVLRELFVTLYAREATASERMLCGNFLGDNPDTEDWRRLITTLFNSKELIYVY